MADMSLIVDWQTDTLIIALGITSPTGLVMPGEADRERDAIRAAVRGNRPRVWRPTPADVRRLVAATLRRALEIVERAEAEKAD
jgi:hypothetical protein